MGEGGAYIFSRIIASSINVFSCRFMKSEDLLRMADRVEGLGILKGSVEYGAESFVKKGLNPELLLNEKELSTLARIAREQDKHDYAKVSNRSFFSFVGSYH
jgi:hypothetical protein